MPAGSPAGFGRRLVQLFASPSALGDEVRERPRWVLPALLGLALAIASLLLIPPEIFVEGFRARQLESGRPMPEGFALDGGTMRLLSVGGITVFWWVMLGLAAGGTTLVFAFVLGDEARFVQHLAAVSWGFVIASLGGLLVAPIRIATRDAQASLGVGTFLRPVLEDGWLLNFAIALDFFWIWAWIVIGIMVSRFDPQRSAGSAITVCLIGVVAIAAALATLGGFGG